MQQHYLRCNRTIDAQKALDEFLADRNRAKSLGADGQHKFKEMLKTPSGLIVVRCTLREAGQVGEHYLTIYYLQFK